MTKTIKQFGDSFFDKRLERIAAKFPFQSFIIMASCVEFLGKCIEQRTDFMADGHSKRDFKSAIDELESLKKYRSLTDFYHTLRCGMLHGIIPNGIKLVKKNNNLTNNIIGAIEFCDDIRKAWQELRNKAEYQLYLNNNFLEVKSTVSGVTSTIQNMNS